MAHEVNQSESCITAQVQEHLASSISSDLFELWIPSDTRWDYAEGVLTLTFSLDFASHLCNKMIGRQVATSLREVVGSHARVKYASRPESDMIRSNNHTVLPPANCATQLALGPAVRSERIMETSLSVETPQTQAGISNGSACSTADGVKVSKADISGGKLSANPNTTTAAMMELQVTSSAAAPSSLWQTIVVGESNQLAWTAMNLVVGQPGRLTPVLIHGPTGTGKSLLLSAVVQRLRLEQRQKRVVHLTSEQFTNDFTESLRGGGLPMFRRKYRDVDSLILDDIQFFIGKRSTLAEARHTIDNLLKIGKQVVLSADRGVAELEALGDDMLGRLRSGLVAPLFPLDSEIRRNLLQQLARSASIDLDESVLDPLSERVSGDGRMIRGIVQRLIAVSALHGGKLTWDECWNAVYDLVQAGQPVVRLLDIERAVCSLFGLDSDSLQSDSKSRSVSQPRMLAMFLARKYTPAAYKEIGDYFGKRRHSTVISAEKTVTDWIKENAKLDSSRNLNVRDILRQVEAQLRVG